MKIGQKLILGFVGVAFLSIVAVTWSAVHFQNKSINNSAYREMKRIKELFFQLEERDTKILASALEVIIQDQAFKDAYMEKDREKLYNYGQPLFQNLKNRYGITHFYFILPDGHNFVRLHNKEIYGDLITRFTFEEARDTKKPASGIELGKTAFALRMVMPYYSGDELIGYVELGEEIDHFLEILKGSTNNEFAIFGHKKLLNREKWRSVRKTAGLSDNWDDLKEHLLIADTTEEREAVGKMFTEENVERIAEEEEEEEVLFGRVRRGDKTFVVGGFEIMDVEGRRVGGLVSLIDITDLIGLAQKAKVTFISMAIVLFILALSASFFISRRISAPIIKLKDAVAEIGQGKLDTRVEIKSKDEIGVLATSFNKMAEDLSGAMEKEKKLAAAAAAAAAAGEKKKAEELASMNEELESTNEELKQTNEELESATEELRKANEEALKAKEMADEKAEKLEKVNKFMTGREFRMVELKEEVNTLLKELGRERRYRKEEKTDKPESL